MSEFRLDLEKSSILDSALEARYDLLQDDHETALRLFNGFYEGWPDLVVDLYARTLVLFNYARSPDLRDDFLDDVQAFLLERLPWVACVIQKRRSAPEQSWRQGKVTFGEKPAVRIREHGVWYAVDLMMNQDASFYLDTRSLRKWLLGNAAGWVVLNTFAYTGSLGIAALAGDAGRVVQVDRNHRFLAMARRSAMFNHLDLGRMKLKTADFFSQVAYYRRSGELFDCIILDPPFFSTTGKGTVDLVRESTRLINKVRPLVRNGGRLVAINNALFLSGAEYEYSLKKLCVGGYLSIEALIMAPPDVAGYSHTIQTQPPRDPAPFNHPTKIAVLRVKRK